MVNTPVRLPTRNFYGVPAFIDPTCRVITEIDNFVYMLYGPERTRRSQIIASTGNVFMNGCTVCFGRCHSTRKQVLDFITLRPSEISPAILVFFGPAADSTLSFNLVIPVHIKPHPSVPHSPRTIPIPPFSRSCSPQEVHYSAMLESHSSFPNQTVH